jgi:hypothetical protein
LLFAFSFTTVNAQINVPNLNVIPFGFTNGALQTFRSVTIYNPVVYALPANLITTLGSAASVDFKDGQGFRPLNGQRNWNINYGSNVGEKILEFRNGPNDDTPVKTRITIKTPQRPYVAPDRIWRITTTETWSRPSSCQNAYPASVSTTLPLALFRNTPFDQQLLAQLNGSAAGTANAYIRFGRENGVPRTFLSRPIIVLDGIDFGSYTAQIEDASLTNTQNFESRVIRHGDTGWDILWTGTEESKTEVGIAETFGMYPNFFEQLSNAGYDVIFLDFQRGADYIQRNALLLKELILRVNRTKRLSPGCASKNVIIGPSMGGQIARIALANMEAQDIDHDTHTYLSFDSPHRGANIPLGVQAAAYWAHLASVNTGSPSLWQSINLPAARQLLLDNLGSAENSRKINVSEWGLSNDFLTGRGSIIVNDNSFSCLRQQYATELAQTGYPRRTRNVALACGSFIGSGQGYPSGSALFDASYFETAGSFGNVLRFNINASGGGSLNLHVTKKINCEPGIVTNQLNCFTGPIIFGGAKPSFRATFILNNEAPCTYTTLYARHLQPNAYPELDNAPGGNRRDIASLKDLLEIVVAEDPELDIKKLRVVQLPDERKQLAFIPTVSAFDLNQPLTTANLFQNVKSQRDNFIQNSITPFEAIFAPDQNLQHVQVDNLMITWVMEQLQTSQILVEPNIGNVVSGATYNFANRRRDNIPTVVVNNNGSIRVNAAGGAGYGGEPNDAPNPFTVWINASCGNSTVAIQNTGTFQVGDGSRVGIVRVGQGATLRIQNGGTLNIQPNSSIQIENGGRLIIEAGANLNLVDFTSSIIIKGGGELIINGQPNISGNGNFIFEKDNIFTLNSNVILQGSDRTIARIIIETDATLVVTNPFELRVENAMIVHGRSGVYPISQRFIWLRNGSTFRANNVSFEDQVLVLIGQPRGAFIVVEDPFDVSNDSDDVDYGFENCSFAGVGTAVELNVPYAQSDPSDWRNVNVEFRNTTFFDCQALRADRSFRTLFEDCTLNNSNIDIAHTYHLIIRNTEIHFAGPLGMNGLPIGERGQAAALKARYVIHLWFRAGSLIDNWETGIEDIEGAGNIIMTDGSTIQKCGTAIKLDGAFNSTTERGLLHMNCARLIQNDAGVSGQDIIFSINARPERTNIFTKNPDNPGLFIESIFRDRQNIDPNLWFFGNYWDGTTPLTTPINTDWSFLVKNGAPQLPSTPWLGTININPVLTDPSVPLVQACGGIMLRGAEDDPLAQNTIVNINGILYNVKIQQDAGMLSLNQNNLVAAQNLLNPVAAISNSIRDTASAVVKHFMSVSRALTFTGGLQYRSKSNGGWIPEAIVGVAKQGNMLAISPNPTNEQFDISLPNGDYDIQVFDAIGKRVLVKNTEGPTTVDVRTWQNGIYMVSLLDKTTKKNTFSKVVVQH